VTPQLVVDERQQFPRRGRFATSHGDKQLRDFAHARRANAHGGQGSGVYPAGGIMRTGRPYTTSFQRRWLLNLKVNRRQGAGASALAETRAARACFSWASLRGFPPCCKQQVKG